MPQKSLYNKISIGIVLFSLILFKNVYSQTCEAYPINCGETLTDLSTDSQSFFNYNIRCNNNTDPFSCCRLYSLCQMGDK